ncbi:DUF1449 domain-containing protein [Cellvibrio sp. NN19]|uniref:DUF1449 domain-containing protein n=1 Tax=Cellvibrio chitinivorans TaxID=3102792 RepID=UPI002B413A76|nr:DUF1449 domain-containing protein [Cellvibrio sp. NN19]
MNEFLLTIVSFPTVFFTFWLGLALLYWLFASFGLVDIELLDVDGPDLDGQLHSHAEHTFAETFSGILLRLGLNGVPVTIVITLIALVGWFTCYYLSYFESFLLGYNWLRYLAGIPILIFSFYVGVLMTAQIIKPLRKLFTKADQHIEKKILGQVAVVRSSRVDAQFGEVNFDDGGAGLILFARSFGDKVFVRGDRVILLEYVPEQHHYRVISEAEFLGKSNE